MSGRFIVSTTVCLMAFVAIATGVDNCSTHSTLIKHTAEFHSGQNVHNSRRNINGADSSNLPVQRSHRDSVNRKADLNKDDDRMHYPDERETQTPTISSLHKSQTKESNCQFGLCNEVDDYPADKIRRLLTKKDELLPYFKDQNLTIINRAGFDEGGDQTLCTTKSHTFYPKKAKNVKGEEMIVVNVDDNKQAIVSEVCAMKGNPCEFSESLPDGIVTSCVQRESLRRLVVLGRKNNEDDLVFDNFPVPSCCVCTYKKVR